MSGATRIIRDDKGQLVRVPAWQSAPPRLRASALTEATPCAENTFSQAAQALGGEPDRTNRPDRTRLPVLFRFFSIRKRP